MTYQTKRDSLTRQSLNIVELDLDTTITDGGKEYLCDGLVPHGQKFWPCVNRIDWVPTRASEDGGLPYFGEVVIHCQNFPWPNGTGTYFGKLLANNQYYLNRLLKIWVGFYEFGETFTFSDFQERRYFIQKIEGPDQKGILKITALDVLSQLKRGSVPVETYGNLNASLTDSATGTINIQDNTNFPNAAGYAIINDEIVSFSGTSGADSLVITARAQLGTVADSHDADSPVRLIYTDDDLAVNAIRTLIEDYTEIDHASYIPDTDWNTERDDFLASENVALRILEPTPVDQIIDEIGKQTYCNIWWDDVAKEIKLKAIGPTLTTTTEWDDDNNILDENITLKRDQSKILTRVFVYYGKIDPTGGNSAENYESLYVDIDATAETGLGDKKIKKIFADHIPNSGSGTASKIASRILAQNSTPIDLRLYVDAKDSDLEVGQNVDINSSCIEGEEGNSVTRLRVIEKAQQENNRYRYRMVFSGVEGGSRYAVIGPNSLADYLSASASDKSTYGWICDTDNEMSNGDNPYLII